MGFFLTKILIWNFYIIIFYLIKDTYLSFRLGVRQRNLSKDFISKILIPEITLKEQNEIVNKLTEERKIIDGNKNLIKIFETKIKNKLNQIWEKYN